MPSLPIHKALFQGRSWPSAQATAEIAPAGLAGSSRQPVTWGLCGCWESWGLIFGVGRSRRLRVSIGAVLSRAIIIILVWFEAMSPDEARAMKLHLTAVPSLLSTMGGRPCGTGAARVW